MGLYVHCQKSFFGPNRKQTPDFMKSIDVIHCLFGLILLEFLYGRLSIEKAHMDFLVSKCRKKILLMDIRISNRIYIKRVNKYRILIFSSPDFFIILRTGILKKNFFHFLTIFIHILMGITTVIFEPK